MSAARRRIGLVVADVAAVLALGGFAVLKAYALGPALSDEGIYFYMCRRIAEGALPYRDFFFAHPPFHLVPGVIVIGLFGFSLPLAKAIPAAATALAGIAVYRAGRRAGPLHGLLGMCLFLFAYDLLRASSHYTGAAEATALIAWALERALAGKPRAAGLLAASAGLTAFYAVPAGVAVCVWMFLRDEESWSAARRYALAYGGLFFGVNLLCAALFRSGYWDPVFRYHFMKPEGGAGNLLSVLAAIARENPWIAWGAPAALMAFGALRTSVARGRRRSGIRRGLAVALSDPAWSPALAGLLIAALHLGFFSALTRVYTFYALPAFVGLALAGGAACAAALVNLIRSIPTTDWMRGWITGSSPGRLKDPGARGGGAPVVTEGASRADVPAAAEGRRRSTSAIRSEAARPGHRDPAPRRILPAAALVVLVAGPPFVIPALFPLEGVDADEGEVLRAYTWRDSPMPDAIDGAVRDLLWQDERVQGERVSVATRYLWHESRHFTAPALLAAKLQELTPPDATLFGDSIAAPLVALMAGRRIARDHVDTNSMRYRSRITPPEDAIAELERDPPDVIIANARRGFFLVPEMKAWVTEHYRLAASIQDSIYGTYDLYLRQE